MADRIFCPYCGCGCSLLLERDANGVPVRTLPDAEDPVSRGRPCVKGLTVHEMISTNRLKVPMLRRKKGEALQPCSWSEAFSFMREKLEEIGLRRNIRDAVYFLGSGEGTNEANYLLSKLCRSHFASNNIDSCARLCHAATGTAFSAMFGLSAIPTYTIDDVGVGDLFLFVGTDPMEDYPVMFNRVLDAKKNGAQILVVDVAGNSTTEQADRFFKISPVGIIPFLSHLIVMLIDGSDIRRAALSFDGFALFCERARSIASANPPSTFGFSREDMDYLNQSLKRARKPVIGFGMGLTQHAGGTQNVYAISGLALLLNAILFPNRGKVNVQGAGDVGTDPFWIPENVDIAKYKWNSGFRSHKGRCSTEALYGNDVEFVWIMGTNPSQSMPDLNSLDASFLKKFVVYAHHHPSRTMEYADVVLPLLALPEEEGTVTNGERRVRGIFRENGAYIGNRKNTTGREGLSHVEAISMFAKSVGAQGFDFTNEKEIFNEMISVVPGYGQLEHEKIVLPEGQYALKEPQRRSFKVFDCNCPHFKNTNFNYVFTTARNRFQFCSGTGSRNSKTLRNLSGEPFAFMNSEDAAVLGVTDGNTVSISSSVGSVEARVKLDASVQKRVIVAPFHFDTLLVNRLTPRVLDPDSKTPCYKEVDVRVEKVL